ncbi:MAG TPA: Fe-S cluster assembly ATPase SufC [Clostridiales bacterium]|nr:Fe-S cluster assembly ATPase SufC [Clostridiales bacterium]
MSDELLKICGLRVSVDHKDILSGLELSIKKGEVHVIMGPNGAGKSTLGYSIMGHPKYVVEEGTILFEGEDITYEKTDIRAKKGIFLSFQNPEELSGVTLESFIRATKKAVTDKPVRVLAFKKELDKTMEELGMDKEYAGRYLNVGFSGGEKKKSEILQMLMQNPKLAILDETDSGLDVDAVKIVSQGIKAFKNDGNSLIIITHSTKILEALEVDYVHILVDGRLIRTGDANLIDEVNRKGYKELALV